MLLYNKPYFTPPAPTSQLSSLTALLRLATIAQIVLWQQLFAYFWSLAVVSSDHPRKLVCFWIMTGTKAPTIKVGWLQSPTSSQSCRSETAKSTISSQPAHQERLSNEALDCLLLYHACHGWRLQNHATCEPRCTRFAGGLNGRGGKTNTSCCTNWQRAAVTRWANSTVVTKWITVIILSENIYTLSYSSEMFFNVLGYNRTLFQEYFERLLGYNVAKVWWPISALRCETLSDTSTERPQ